MKKHKLTIATLKYRALQLRNSKQIPLYLAYLINQLEGIEETKYISYLKECALHYLRVKNYYKLFPSLEDEAEKNIKEGLKQLGFTVIDINANKR